MNNVNGRWTNGCISLSQVVFIRMIKHPFPDKIKSTIGIFVSHHSFAVINETSVICGVVGVGIKLSRDGRLTPKVTAAVVNPQNVYQVEPPINQRVLTFELGIFQFPGGHNLGSRLNPLMIMTVTHSLETSGGKPIIWSSVVMLSTHAKLFFRNTTNRINSILFSLWHDFFEIRWVVTAIFLHKLKHYFQFRLSVHSDIAGRFPLIDKVCVLGRIVFIINLET